MKKLLSLALAASLLLGTTSMEAGNKLKKTWAYAKMGLGVVSGITAILNFKNYPVRSYRLHENRKEQLALILKDKDKDIVIKTGETELKETREIATFLLDFGKKGQEITKDREAPFFSYFLLTILLWKSGKQDLRRIRKQELKEKKHHETKC